MPSVTAKMVPRFATRFTLFYAVILLFWWSFSLSACTHRVVVAATARLLPVLAGTDISHAFGLHRNGEIHVEVEGKGAQGRYDLHPSYGHNALFFLALVFATPGMSWKQRSVAAALGTGGILLANTVIMAGNVLEFDGPDVAGISPYLPSGVLATLARVVAKLAPTGGPFMVPAFLWGFVLLGYPSLYRKLGGKTARLGRNDPCPCGSSLKFKRCCG